MAGFPAELDEEGAVDYKPLTLADISRTFSEFLVKTVSFGSVSWLHVPLFLASDIAFYSRPRPCQAT